VTTFFGFLKTPERAYAECIPKPYWEANGMCKVALVGKISELVPVF